MRFLKPYKNFNLNEEYIDTVKKDIQSYLNYHLGSNEDYVKVTDVQNIDKDTVVVEYEVHLSIPTGSDEYERDTEYRSLAFQYRDGRWEPKLEESRYDIKTKTESKNVVATGEEAIKYLWDKIKNLKANRAYRKIEDDFINGGNITIVKDVSYVPDEYRYRFSFLEEVNNTLVEIDTYKNDLDWYIVDYSRRKI